MLLELLLQTSFRLKICYVATTMMERLLKGLDEVLIGKVSMKEFFYQKVVDQKIV